MYFFGVEAASWYAAGTLDLAFDGDYIGFGGFCAGGFFGYFFSFGFDDISVCFGCLGADDVAWGLYLF